jgi:hypothetical protein
MIIFSIEIVFTFFIKGVWAFFMEEYLNPFDAGVLILSWIQFGMTGGLIVGAFNVFRLFRLLRLFNYFESWKRVNNLTAEFPKIFPQLVNTLILLLLFMFVFAVLGMQILGGEYTPEDFPEKPRLHYDSFWSAFISTFTVRFRHLLCFVTGFGFGHIETVMLTF